jgi:hypothetical protein
LALALIVWRITDAKVDLDVGSATKACVDVVELLNEF